MTAPVLFMVCTVALAALVVVWLVPVLWRGPKAFEIDRGSVNAAVLRDQLAELDRDLANGILSGADYAQAKQELQRRALEEASPQPSGTTTGGSKRAAFAFAVLVPLVAGVVYLSLGSPAALLPPAAPAELMQPDIEAMVASLEQKLKSNPGDAGGWAMLARSYRAFGRHEDAAKAFSKAGAVMNNDARMLAEYAETLAINRQGSFKGEPTQLIERALSLDPKHPYALALAGAAAFERADYDGAIESWQRLHAQLPSDSEAARVIAERVESARSAKAERRGLGR